MRIRIVTFSFAYNYGAWLQMYGLQTYLEACGHDVTVLDYQPLWLEGNDTGRGLKAMILGFVKNAREKKFDELTKDYIHLSKPCKNVSDVACLTQPELYIAGSDQIWNLKITNGYDDIYFLNFQTSANKMFYAASIGLDNIDVKMIKDIETLISNVQKVSVREKELCNTLKENTSINAIHVLDPVFLPEIKAYNSIIKPCKERNFVLIYKMVDDDRCYTLARRIAIERNLSIIEIGKIRKRDGIEKTKEILSPGEFLGYILGASYIITNSFHGTALSVKFSKQFYSVELKQRQSRISSLLDAVGLENRIVSDVEHVQIKDICYVEANEKLNERIEESRSFILNAIEEYDSYKVEKK